MRALDTDPDSSVDLGICYCANTETSDPDTLQEGSSPFPGTFSAYLISTTQIGREHILHVLILLLLETLSFQCKAPVFLFSQGPCSIIHT